MKLANCLVFFDFDNTITTFDVLDDIIERFSINKDWIELERLWKEGKIGSRECLQGQLALVRIAKRELARYLSGIKVDPYFKNLLALLKKRQMRPIILSDNFSFIIKEILRNNSVNGLKVYSNRLKFHKDRILPVFPHINLSCFRCGHCKKTNLSKDNFRGKIIYIGDGFSDICPALKADFVFAKGSLLRHFKKIKRDAIAFKDLGDIYNYLKGVG